MAKRTKKDVETQEATKIKQAIKKTVSRKSSIKSSSVKDDVVVEDKSKTEWKTYRGRPVVFDPQKAISLMEEEIDRYVNDRIKVYQYLDKDPDNEEKGKVLLGKMFPTLTKVALKCGVTTETFSNYCRERNDDGSLKNEQLFDTFTKYKEIGRELLLEGGAMGVYSDRYVQFVGNVNYGMIPSTKTEATVEVKNMDKVYAELDEIHNGELARLEQQRLEMQKRRTALAEINNQEKENGDF